MRQPARKWAKKLQEMPLLFSLQGSNFSSTKLSKTKMYAWRMYWECVWHLKNFFYRVYHSSSKEEKVDKLSIYMEIGCVWNVINKTRFEMCRMPHRTVLSFLNRKKARLYREALCVWAIWASIRWWCLTFSFCAKKITMKVLRRLLFFPPKAVQMITWEMQNQI